jgi:RNA polymerase sigma-70 factor (ECF subfamily)
MTTVITCAPAVVVDPPAFLARTTTRLAINLAQSARVRREMYVGPWLPEPVDTSVDPAVGAERGEALEFALLLLLEKLSPAERAAYILREAFDYPYGEIADILHLSAVRSDQQTATPVMQAAVPPPGGIVCRPT